MKLEAIKTAVRGALVDICFIPITLADRYSVRIKQNFETACWGPGPPHYIFVGDKVLDNSLPDLDSERVTHYVKSYVFHEMAHMRWTTLKLKELGQQCQDENVPFRLLNLFEDARIEHLWRKAIGRPFEWAMAEPAPESSQWRSEAYQVNPSSLFFRWIQLDGQDPEIVDSVFLTEYLAGAPKNETLFSLIRKFYQRVLTVARTEDLMPILKEWLATFPAETHPSEGDLSVSLSLTSQEALAGFLDASDEIDEKPSENEESKEAGMVEITESLAGTSEQFFSHGARTIPQDRVKALTRRLTKLIEAPVPERLSRMPGHRLSVKHYVTGRPCFKGGMITKVAKKKLGLIVDCSGSMVGDPMNEGRILFACLNALAKADLLSCTLYLSGVLGNRSAWVGMTLPVPVSVLENIHGFAGAEGLAQTILCNANDLRRCDSIWVYTDGEICDTAVDKADMRLKGLQALGLYVGQVDKRKSLSRYFDKVISRQTVEDLVLSMVAGCFARR